MATVVEEHGAGQLVRLRCRPTLSRAGVLVTLLLAALCAVAGLNGAVAAAVALGILAGALGLRSLSEVSAAMALARGALGSEGGAAQ